jgi:hypothetical protein
MIFCVRMPTAGSSAERKWRSGTAPCRPQRSKCTLRGLRSARQQAEVARGEQHQCRGGAGLALDQVPRSSRKKMPAVTSPIPLPLDTGPECRKQSGPQQTEPLVRDDKHRDLPDRAGVGALSVERREESATQ